MATLVGTQSNPVSLLRGLVELDFDAIEAYETAIARLDNPSYRERMTAFCDDHRRHVTELNPIIERLGGKPVSGPDVKRVLTKGKVVLASIMGDDAILVAMKTNEEDTSTAYERAAAHHELDADLVAILARNLADERRHRGWIMATLGAKLDQRIAEVTGRTSTPAT